MKGICVLVWLIMYAGSLTPVNAQATKVIEPIRIAVSENKATNLIFPYPIRKGYWVSSSLTIQQLEGAENILLVKAEKAGFAETNLTVVTSDGRFYSFLITYAPEPSVLNLSFSADLPAGKLQAQLTDMPVTEEKLQAIAMQVIGKSPFLKFKIREQKTELRLGSIYYSHNLMWFYITFQNRSQVDYTPEYVRFFVQDKKRPKRTAIQEKELQPVFVLPNTVFKGNSTNHLALAFAPFTIGRNQQLVIKVAEKNGGRTLALPVHYKTLLKTRRLP